MILYTIINNNNNIFLNLEKWTAKISHRATLSNHSLQVSIR